MTASRRLSSDLYRQATNWLLPIGVQDMLLRFGKRTTGTRFVFMACFPKSGSTLLSESLNSLPGWKRLSSIPPDWTREQEPIHEYIARDWIAAGNNVIFKNHISHSDYLSSLLEYYGMHCCFLIRDLADVCCSLADHFDQESTTLPFVTLDDQQLSRIDAQDERARFIVDLAIPWYVNCYASWMKYISDGRQCQVVRYEDLAEDSIDTVGRVVSAIGVQHSEDEIRSAIARATSLPNRSRLNVGIAGRGHRWLDRNPIAKATIQRYISYYPDIDFSPIYNST